MIILFFFISDFSHTQSVQYSPIFIGDKAPSLYLSTWIKGSAIERFKKGQIYVVEFWATWCRPCIASMPRLSVLNSKFKNEVTFIGVDIYEKKSTTIKKIKEFVDSMGSQMNYNVVIEDSNFMETHWMNPIEGRNNSIPKSFVIDAEGRLAWVGHPKNLEPVLTKILNKEWSLNVALDKWKLNKRLDSLDYATGPYLNSLLGDGGEIKNPNILLAKINKMINKEPLIKHCPNIVNFTFSALLQTSFQEAYDYGYSELFPTADWESNYDVIISNIKGYSKKLNLPAKIYQLGVEAYQIYIDNLPYPEIMNMHKIYNTVANWSLKARDTIKAREFAAKAINFGNK